VSSSADQHGPVDRLQAELTAAVGARRGHFRYESGHHGDLWLDLEPLLVDTQRLRRWAAALAREARSLGPDTVCGPLSGGAFVAQMLAGELDSGFVFTERSVQDHRVSYRLPAALREAVAGQRILVADDAVNAGSALLATLRDLQDCGGKVVGFASLIALGEAAPQISRQHAVPSFALATLERGLWRASECPLCRADVPLS
jgi:orotate phosphoribosyltransferase